MSEGNFVHLHLHTEYSLVDGLLRIEPLMTAVKASAMKAVAVTDYCNLFAAVKVYRAALASGIKPILGVEIPFSRAGDPQKLFSVVLLCQNEQGYRNLTRLISKAYQEGQRLGQAQLCFEWLADHAEGLIALSGGCRGDIGQALLQDNLPLAQSYAKEWIALFADRFYLELMRTDREGEALYNQAVLGIADEMLIPIVASNDVRFLKQADFDAHEARVCIHRGDILADDKRVKAYSSAQYLRSPTEMASLFADLPQALANSVEIAKRCTVILSLGEAYLPQFPTPDKQSDETYLTKLADMGLAARLEQLGQNHFSKLNSSIL